MTWILRYQYNLLINIFLILVRSCPYQSALWTSKMVYLVRRVWPYRRRGHSLWCPSATSHTRKRFPRTRRNGQRRRRPYAGRVGEELGHKHPRRTPHWPFASSRACRLFEIHEVGGFFYRFTKRYRPKKLAAFKGFKKAFFSFRDLYLSYHTGSKDVNSPPLGHFSLKGKPFSLLNNLFFFRMWS